MQQRLLGWMLWSEVRGMRTLKLEGGDEGDEDGDEEGGGLQEALEVTTCEESTEKEFLVIGS